MSTSPSKRKKDGKVSEIRSNIARVMARMAEAARRVGRDPDSVRLVAVTKQRSVEELRELLATGQRVFGENRVEETLDKMEAFSGSPDLDIEWHFIGHVQSRKAKLLAGSVALIHGVDSLHLAEAFQRAADQKDCLVNILLEVNVSGEESKFGLSPVEVSSVAKQMRALDRVCCQGLMTMAPYVANPEETRPVFRGLRELFERLRDEGNDHLDLRHLSMGMTNDFEVAVEEGATLTRVGTALFESHPTEDGKGAT
jgi:pyridoxal phosphate enzyme (YggS family)